MDNANSLAKRMVAIVGIQYGVQMTKYSRFLDYKVKIVVLYSIQNGCDVRDY